MLINIYDKNKKDILVQMINQVIDANQWNNKKAAHILCTALSDISCIRRSKAANFSLARMLIFLVRLNCEVTIVINSKETTEQAKSFKYAISASHC